MSHSLPMLQVALDNQTLSDAYKTTRLIAEEVDIIEVGTILCVGEGVRAVRGGREHDWTLGANWYLGSHLKLQANYVRASSERGTLALDPRVFELRAQVAF